MGGVGAVIFALIAAHNWDVLRAGRLVPDRCPTRQFPRAQMPLNPYQGTRETNMLIVGAPITAAGAFA
jgi:hypothetical protein